MRIFGLLSFCLLATQSKGEIEASHEVNSGNFSCLMLSDLVTPVDCFPFDAACLPPFDGSCSPSDEEFRCSRADKLVLPRNRRDVYLRPGELKLETLKKDLKRVVFSQHTSGQPVVKVAKRLRRPTAFCSTTDNNVQAVIYGESKVSRFEADYDKLQHKQILTDCWKLLLTYKRLQDQATDKQILTDCRKLLSEINQALQAAGSSRNETYITEEHAVTAG